jgi:hypothetical protein
MERLCCFTAKADESAIFQAANSITATTCSCDKWNQSIISLIEAPTSRLSKTTETGVRVSRNTHAPLRLPGMLSTAGHRDQSRVAILLPPVHRSLLRSFLPRFGGPRYLSGVDVEAEDCVYFYRFVAAKYGTEFPGG